MQHIPLFKFTWNVSIKLLNFLHLSYESRNSSVLYFNGFVSRKKESWISDVNWHIMNKNDMLDKKKCLMQKANMQTHSTIYTAQAHNPHTMQHCNHALIDVRWIHNDEKNFMLPRFHLDSLSCLIKWLSLCSGVSQDIKLSHFQVDRFLLTSLPLCIISSI